MNNKAHTLERLAQYQALPLSLKISLSKRRIRGWVYVYGTDASVVLMTFSPESTVLLHMVNSLYPDVKVAFEFKTGMKPITSWMASADVSGIDEWLTYGCNSYDAEQPVSKPMSFWNKEDVYEYLRTVI